MKKSLSIIIICILCLLFAGCGQTAQAPQSGADTGAEEVTAAEPEAEEPAQEEDASEKKRKTRNNDDEEEFTTITDKADNSITDEECNAIIERLEKTEPVHPEEEIILRELTNCVTCAGLIDELGEVFSEMDNDSKARLRYQILSSLTWPNSPIYEDISEELGDGESGASVEVVEAIFRDAYGEEDFVPGEYENVKDGNYIFMFGDGEPWHIIEHMQFFEDDDYILLSGPMFYEDNGGAMEFSGYADVLFAKNAESRYKVSLLYSKLRGYRVTTASIEASSELPPSGDKTYSATNLIDGDCTTVWCEGVPGTGLGETITVHLDKVQPVFGVMICNGYTASYEQYKNNGMLTDIKVDFGGGTIADGHNFEGYGAEGYSAVDLADMNRCKVELDEPVMTDKVVITITGAKKGAKYDDTCVSEVLVY